MEKCLELQIEIDKKLQEIGMLYLIYCIPEIVLLNDGSVIFTYRWTSFEMEQAYYDLLSKLKVLTLKLKAAHEEKLHRTIEKKD